MKKIRLLLLFVILLLLFAAISAAASPSPYAIQVNRAWNTATIYAADETGAYTLPVKAMICSTARPGYVTPLGSFQLSAYRSQWQLMVDDTYGQYATQFKGNYLFHSICYTDHSHDTMVRESYNNLGNAASMGCVRLETADAKWIFDNCPAGTPVTIYEDYSSPGPLGKPSKTISYIDTETHNGWDPTDPADGNPWHTAEVTTLDISPAEWTMTAGEAATLEAAFEPKTAVIQWRSSDPAVVQVDNGGNVTALSAGEATIAASSLKGVSAQCTITVTGELLPFDDLLPGAWYYSDVRKAIEKDIFRGIDDRTFAPNESMTRAMVVQALYNLAGAPAVRQKPDFADVADDAWYADAVAWAAQKSVVKGVSGGCFAPDRSMTRQELATVLWRYAGSSKTKSDLSQFKDAAQVASYAETAMIWMTEQGFLQGSNDCLLPAKTATRAETAAILLRYDK